MIISIANLHLDGPLKTRWDYLLRFVADIEIEISDSIVFSEKEVPVVELSVQIIKWLSVKCQKKEDFIYSTLDSDEEYIFAFRRGGETDEFYFMSPWMDNTKNIYLSTEELRRGLMEFVNRIRAKLYETVDILEFVDEQETREIAQNLLLHIE